MFVSLLHLAGSCVSELVAEPPGPRNCGQSSATATEIQTREKPSAVRIIPRMNKSFRVMPSRDRKEAGAEPLPYGRGSECGGGPFGPYGRLPYIQNGFPVSSRHFCRCCSFKTSFSICRRTESKEGGSFP